MATTSVHDTASITTSLDPERDQVARALQLLALLPGFERWVAQRAERAGAHVGISLRQFAALYSIVDGTTTPGELARLWQVTPAVLTGITDRLERRGLIERQSDPRDRRRVQLVVTPAGHAVFDEITRALTTDVAAQLARATPTQLAALDDALPLLTGIVAALRANIATTPAPPPADDCLSPDEPDDVLP